MAKKSSTKSPIGHAKLRSPMAGTMVKRGGKGGKR